MNAPDSASVSQRRLRVAVLSRVFKSTGGGAERYSIALVEQLAARHDIHVFAQQIEHQNPGVTYHRIGQALTRPRWINQLWFAFATWKSTRTGFDVVHSHELTWYGNVQTVHVLPVKFTLFHQIQGWRRVARWLKVCSSPRLLAYLLLERLRYQPADNKAIVVTSNSLQEKLRQAYPLSHGALEVVTPGVDAVPGLATPQQQQAARGKLGLPSHGKCLLWVGNDYQKKGLDCALAALAALPENCFLSVVGNSAHIAAYQPTVQRLGIGNRVFFLGSLTDTSPAYQAADCLVHPTLEDTFAMVVLEAMAHGLPVVISAAQYCGITELLTHGIHALVLPDPRDAAQLVLHVQSLLADPLTYSRLSEAGTRFAQDYTWPNLAVHQEAIYYRVAS